MAADYLFQPDKHYDVSYDTGDKVIQCGRHNDIFKFWLMWRAKVRLSKFGALIATCAERAESQSRVALPVPFLSRGS